MNARALCLQGFYYDGTHPLRRAATLSFAAGEATLRWDEDQRRYRAQSLVVSPRVGRADRFIALPDGGQFHCADGRTLDLLPQHSRSEGAVAWLEHRVGVAVASVFMIFALLIGGHQYGLPVAAQQVAEKIPLDTERALGEEAMAWLDDNEWFMESQLDEETQDSLRAQFEAMYAGLPYAQHYRLVFRQAEWIGANAFALPGGTIVITDEMVDSAWSDEEVMAILAHEIGHVERRHVMRQILQDSAVAVVAATLTGDAATLSAAVAGLPVVLAQAEYSRDFESEADDFAFDLLHRHGMSAEAFASIMERIDDESCDDDAEPGGLDFLSTHPVTSERVERARAAARQWESL